MARRGGATEKQLNDLLKVAADAAEELGFTGLAEVLRLVGPSTDLESLARQQAQADYYAEVQSVAGYVADAVIDTGVELVDAVDEAVDGHQFVIYTGKNLDVLVASSNWLAAEEDGIVDFDITGSMALLARGAMYRDVLEAAQQLIEDHDEAVEEEGEEE